MNETSSITRHLPSEQNVGGRSDKQSGDRTMLSNNDYRNLATRYHEITSA